MKNQPGNMKNQPGTMKNHENRLGTMENRPGTINKQKRYKQTHRSFLLYIDISKWQHTGNKVGCERWKCCFYSQSLGAGRKQRVSGAPRSNRRYVAGVGLPIKRVAQQFRPVFHVRCVLGTKMLGAESTKLLTSDDVCTCLQRTPASR